LSVKLLFINNNYSITSLNGIILDPNSSIHRIINSLNVINILTIFNFVVLRYSNDDKITNLGVIISQHDNNNSIIFFFWFDCMLSINKWKTWVKDGLLNVFVDKTNNLINSIDDLITLIFNSFLFEIIFKIASIICTSYSGDIVSFI
jgi:hypothetical protein